MVLVGSTEGYKGSERGSIWIAVCGSSYLSGAAASPVPLWVPSLPVHNELSLVGEVSFYIVGSDTLRYSQSKPVGKLSRSMHSSAH